MLPEPYCNVIADPSAFPSPECGGVDSTDPDEANFYVRAVFEYTCDGSPQIEEEEEEDDQEREAKAGGGGEDDSFSVSDVEVITEREAQLYIPHNLLLDKSWGPLVLSNVLSAMSVPTRDHAFFTDRILFCARTMASSSLRQIHGTEVLPMLAIIRCHLNEVEEREAATGLGSYMDMFSIKGPRTVTVEGEAERCCICWEDILVGSEAARVPCSHIYHHQCILAWLLKTRTCPLCRFHILSTD
ncbi:hypothetical protein CDL15_Pgr003609 [Punica granatum]|nr:hypothetical protein CDL15_Pgr003609 [Punica granatum]